MNSVRKLAFVAVAAGAAAEAMHNGTPQGKVIEMLPKIARDDACAELPTLCTAPATMHGYATTVTYLCSGTTTTRERSTVHVTITRTTTVTPSSKLVPTVPVVAPVTEEPDTTTTVHSTLTEYTTITLVSGSPGDFPTPPSDFPTPPLAASITGYLSTTIPSELSSATPTETQTDPVYTIQTSTDPPVMTTPGYDFPTMSPPVANGSTTGIFYSAPLANSSLVQPTPFFPNTTAAHSHFTLPTASFVNRAPEEVKNNRAGKLGASLAALGISMVVVILAA